MLVEFTFVPVGANGPLADQVVEVVRLIEAANLAHQVTPSSICIEAEWDEVMPLLKRCQELVRRSAKRTFWMIKIDDEEGVRDKLTRHVQLIGEMLGRQP